MKISQKNTQSGAIFLKLILFFVIVSGIALVSVGFVFGKVVPLGTVGVRKIAFGWGQGLSEKPLEPGYHWTIPGYSAIYLVPQLIKVLHFEKQHTSNAKAALFPVLAVPTVDGTTVDVDVSVFTRFYSQRGEGHGGPMDLINGIGASESEWERYIHQVVDNELKRALGALSTVDFYNPHARDQGVRIAEEEINKRLASVGIELLGVFLRRYTYREEIDEAIFKKNLQEVEMSYNKVASEFAEAARDVKRVETEGDVTIANLDKKGLSEIDKIKSEGDLYRREKIAQADLLVAEARAEVDRRKGEVLARKGGDVYVGLQMAKTFGSLKGGIVSEVDPFDYNTWVKRLGLSKSDVPVAQAGKAGELEKERESGKELSKEVTQ